MKSQFYEVNLYKGTYYKETEKLDIGPLQRNEVPIRVFPLQKDNNGDNNLGNIFNDDMDNIINSNKYQDMLNGFKNKRLVSPLCQRCGYIKRFK